MYRLKDKDWMNEQYINNRRSTPDIAKEIGCTPKSVRDNLIKLDIKLRDNSSSHIIDERNLKFLEDADWVINEYITNAKSIITIGKELGYSGRIIKKYLKKHNIHIRDIKECQLLHSSDSIALLENEEWLYDQYITKRLSSNEIADTLNTTGNRVCKYLKKFNINARTNTEAKLEGVIKFLEDKEWMYTEYKINKKSAYDIGKELHISDLTVAKYLRLHEIPITKCYHVSSYERAIQEFLEEHGINFIASDRSQIKPKELDIYIPEHHLAIELNGVYWHSLNKEQDML
jgi:predicted transcriptional regulator